MRPPLTAYILGLTTAAAAVSLLAIGQPAFADPPRHAGTSAATRAGLPAWARQRRTTVFVDSVLLSGKAGLRRAMPARRFELRGRPALMIRAATAEVRSSGRRVAPLVIVGLGYNSLWERGRRRYRYWARRFDGEAYRLLAALRRRGARQVVWVTLREPKARFLTSTGRAELGRYSWYFPYVNERLRALDRRRKDVVLADWASESDRVGLTYDSIHLTPRGAALMGRTIRRAIRLEAARQSPTAGRMAPPAPTPRTPTFWGRPAPAYPTPAAVTSAAAGPAPPRRPTRLTIAATGDFLIHGPVFRRALAYGRGRRYDFRPMLRRIRPVIAGADLALCHVETPLTPGPPRGYPSFRTPLGLAAGIRATGWDACSTASNHTLDAGLAGVRTTLRALDRAGIGHTGSHRTRAGARRPAILKAKGVNVAFLAYTALTNGQVIPHPWTLDLARPRRILRDARRARRAGAQAVIVNVHWGAEYRHAPTGAQIRLARALTRSPAVTAVVGQHAHVVQPIRWIHGKPVVFGEGNLLSNQTAACCPAAAQDGLVALLDLRADSRGVRPVGVRYLPIYVRHPDFTVVRAGGASRRRTLAVVGRSERVRPMR